MQKFTSCSCWECLQCLRSEVFVLCRQPPRRNSLRTVWCFFGSVSRACAPVSKKWRGGGGGNESLLCFCKTQPSRGSWQNVHFRLIGKAQSHLFKHLKLFKWPFRRYCADCCGYKPNWTRFQVEHQPLASLIAWHNHSKWKLFCDTPASNHCIAPNDLIWFSDKTLLAGFVSCLSLHVCTCGGQLVLTFEIFFVPGRYLES